MKILLVNNYYYYRGGDCTYLFALKSLLEKKGHNVVVFSMHHPQNVESTWSKYFVSYINYDEEVKKISFSSGIKVATRTIFYFKAKKMIEKLLREEKPDIAHLHNIHNHITLSILYPLKKHNIPIVWTLHDYQLICANISFLANGKICERCKKKRYYAPLLMKCKKGSFSASLMSSIEIILHNLMRIDRLVDKFIAPSKFLENKFIEYGINKEKIKCLHYFIDGKLVHDTYQESDYYLYVGRISWEKGVKTLIDAAVKVSLNGDNAGSTKGNKLKIVGDGSLLEEMTSYVRSKDKNNVVEFLGHKSHKDVIKLIKGCRFLVVPSEWYENYPFAVIEAFICRKPVVGSRIGGIPELIKDYETGLTFKFGDKEDLAAAIRYLLSNPDLVEEMGRNARRFVEEEMLPERHYEKLMEIYINVLHKHKSV